LVSTVFSWIIWFIITCLFWPATFGVVNSSKPYNRDVTSRSTVTSLENDNHSSLSSSCTANFDRRDLALATQIGTPCISLTGLIVDTIALLRLGACTECACPGSVADCVDRLSRSPLLLPKLVFHGLLVALMMAVLILTNVLFCPDAAILINIVAPVIIIFYTFHSINVYRLREFKRRAIAAKPVSNRFFGRGEEDAVDGAGGQGPNDDMSGLLTLTRKGVGRRALPNEPPVEMIVTSKPVEMIVTSKPAATLEDSLNDQDATIKNGNDAKV